MIHEQFTTKYSWFNSDQQLGVPPDNLMPPQREELPSLSPPHPMERLTTPMASIPVCTAPRNPVCLSSGGISALWISPWSSWPFRLDKMALWIAFAHMLYQCSSLSEVYTPSLLSGHETYTVSQRLVRKNSHGQVKMNMSVKTHSISIHLVNRQRLVRQSL